MYLNYKGGKLNIPKLPVYIQNGVVDKQEYIDIIAKEAIALPLPATINDVTKVYNSPENKISDFPLYSQAHPDLLASQYWILDKEYEYELWNGNKLYLNCIYGSENYVFSLSGFIIVKPDSDLSVVSSFVQQSSTYLSTSQGNYGIMRKFLYMFIDIEGNLWCTYMESSTYKPQMFEHEIKPDSELWDLLFKDNEVKPPFQEDTNEPQGGDGDYDFHSEAVPVSPLPSKSAVDTGFVTLYNPTNDQLKSLAEYLWTSDFTTAVKKMFNDPMDAILSLSFVPVKPNLAGVKDVSVGFVPTGVSMNIAASQYIQFDCGSVNVKEQWGNCLDYAPFTKVSIYLPYIGEKVLDIDDVMNNTIHLYYNIDLLSGSCVAQLYFTNKNQPGRVLYTFSGVCATSLPISGRDFSQLIMSGINLVTSGAAMIATGGTTASAVGSMLINNASNVTAAKPVIQKTSAVASSTGLLSNQKPYLIFTYPRQSLPNNYKSFQGYPSNITSALSELTGYTVVEHIHIENIPCTETERTMIETLLKGGVII